MSVEETPAAVRSRLAARPPAAAEHPTGGILIAAHPAQPMAPADQP